MLYCFSFYSLTVGAQHTGCKDFQVLFLFYFEDDTVRFSGSKELTAETFCLFML